MSLKLVLKSWHRLLHWLTALLPTWTNSSLPTWTHSALVLPLRLTCSWSSSSPLPCSRPPKKSITLAPPLATAPPTARAVAATIPGYGSPAPPPWPVAIHCSLAPPTTPSHTPSLARFTSPDCTVVLTADDLHLVSSPATPPKTEGGRVWVHRPNFWVMLTLQKVTAPPTKLINWAIVSPAS